MFETANTNRNAPLGRVNPCLPDAGQALIRINDSSGGILMIETFRCPHVPCPIGATSDTAAESWHSRLDARADRRAAGGEGVKG